MPKPFCRLIELLYIYQTQMHLIFGGKPTHNQTPPCLSFNFHLNTHTCTHFRHISEDGYKGEAAELTSGIAGYVSIKGKSVLTTIGGQTEDNRYDPEIDNVCGVGDVGALMTVPVFGITREVTLTLTLIGALITVPVVDLTREVIGILTVTNLASNKSQFSKKDLVLAEGFAGMVASAMEKSQTFSEMIEMSSYVQVMAFDLKLMTHT